jgi:hypothetical protein
LDKDWSGHFKHSPDFQGLAGDLKQLWLAGILGYCWLGRGDF